MQSRSNFLPDDKLQLRRVGTAAITEEYTSDPIELGRLSAYWHVSDIGTPEKLVMSLNVSAISDTLGEVYTLTLEVDSAEAFTTPTTIAAVTSANFSTGVYELAISREALARAESNAAAWLRLKVTMATGYDMASITLTDFLVSADQVDLEDGTSPADNIVVGTPETGTITFSAVADNGDTVTINDGTASAVFTFAAAGNGAVGAAVNVATGATATASAQNLLAAINANTTIRASASGGSTVLTVTNLRDFAGTGAITKSDADNDYAIVDFSGAVAGVKTEAMLLKANALATFDDQLDDMDTVITATTRFTATRSGHVLSVRNLAVAAGAASAGTATEATDAGNVMTVADFAVAAGSVTMWAYFKPPGR